MKKENKRKQKVSSLRVKGKTIWDLPNLMENQAKGRKLVLSKDDEVIYR